MPWLCAADGVWLGGSAFPDLLQQWLPALGFMAHGHFLPPSLHYNRLFLQFCVKAPPPQGQ